MNIRKLADIEPDYLTGKRVVVRLDFDVPGDDYSRIEASLPTIKFLQNHNCRMVLIGHKGRPNGKPDPNFSMQSLVGPVSRFIGLDVLFANSPEEAINAGGQIVLMENLRYFPGEEENDSEFSKELSSLGEIYVNEAFATSHRAHASFVGITKYITGYAGFRLASEIEKLGKVTDDPIRPLTFLISGLKEDKVEMIKKIRSLADKILVGGKLPYYIERMPQAEDFEKDEKLVIAKLNPDGEDITMNSIEKFEGVIAESGTIVLAGVVGKYEDPNQIFGTKRVFQAVANAKGYKIAGGGDTESVLTSLGLTQKFDWISVGGGAMLEFLAGNKLPGIEVLKV